MGSLLMLPKPAVPYRRRRHECRQHLRPNHCGALRRKDLRHSTPHRVLFSSRRELIGSVVNTVTYEFQGAYRLQAFS